MGHERHALVGVEPIAQHLIEARAGSGFVRLTHNPPCGKNRIDVPGEPRCIRRSADQRGPEREVIQRAPGIPSSLAQIEALARSIQRFREVAALDENASQVGEVHAKDKLRSHVRRAHQRDRLAKSDGRRIELVERPMGVGQVTA